ncbi:MAG: hypothetical protein ABSD44_07725 [Terracidiphilus sp.]
MDEDPRFPNRKRIDREPLTIRSQSGETNPQDPNGEKAEAAPLPLSSYKVVGSDRVSPEPCLPVAEPQTPVAPSEAVEEPQPAEAPPTPPPSFHGFDIAGIRRFAESPTRVYAAIGVALGILLGVVIAAVSVYTSGPVGRYDMGSASSSSAGLTGHLFIQWDKKLKYRLAIKPSSPERQAGFALAVASSPRPLSIALNVQDAEGFVLCSRQIVLVFDPGNAANAATFAPGSAAGNVSNGSTAQENDLAGLAAQEAARERGADIFQNQTGPDGQIEAINAQGEIGCLKGAYEKATGWNFTPNFPSVAEQDEWLKRVLDMQAGAVSPTAPVPAPRKKIVVKVPPKLPAFSVEGDDAIVDFDASSGIVQTRGRKTFLVGHVSAAVADSGWQDYPVSVHYRCDSNAACTLTHTGFGTLHARLGK